jgi:excisionase family DNA binding protein
MDKSEVAGLLKASTRTVDRLRKDGLLKTVKVRGRVRFALEDVVAYVRLASEGGAK